MHLGALDLAVIAATLVISVVVGLRQTRRGKGDLVSYFAADRALPWWIAGTSIVATSFAADTPLAIARIVRTQGLLGNWYWWSGGIGFVVCMFLFAPLWRRSRVLTDAEIIELRYGDRAAAGLRGFLAVFRGVLANGITMGWVLLGMQKIIGETLGWPREASMVGLIALSLVYTAAAGLWGVVVTDVLQFGLAMFGSIALMVAVYAKIGGPAALAEASVSAAQKAQAVAAEKAAVAAEKAAGAAEAAADVVLEAGLVGADSVSAIADPATLLSFVPNLDAGGAVMATFAFYVGIQWLGGAEGGGFLAQRLFATRNEKHAVLALLWFAIAHFALRAWPWIVVGLGSIVLLPELADPETAYPRLMVQLLPAGILGLMVASLLAAFMSTISTHLHWGASYVVNDIYLRFMRPGCGDEEALRVSRMAVGLMALIAAAMAWQMDSVFGAWLYLSEIGAGAALIGALRWYWWRLNAASEISALVTSLVLSNALRLVDGLEDEAMYPLRFVIVLSSGTIVAFAVALLTRPTPTHALDAFYRRVRPGGWWGPVAARCPEVSGDRIGVDHLVAVVLGVATLFGGLFGLGALALGMYGRGAALLAVAIGALVGLLRRIQRFEWATEQLPANDSAG